MKKYQKSFLQLYKDFIDITYFRESPGKKKTKMKDVEKIHTIKI